MATDPVRESAAVVQELLAELEGLRREARQDAGPVVTGRAVGLGEAMDLIRLRLAGYRLAGPGEVVVRLPEPDQSSERHGTFWLLSSGDAAYADEMVGETAAAFERDALAMLAAARWRATTPVESGDPAGER